MIARAMAPGRQLSNSQVAEEKEEEGVTRAASQEGEEDETTNSKVQSTTGTSVAGKAVRFASDDEEGKNKTEELGVRREMGVASGEVDEWKHRQAIVEAIRKCASKKQSPQSSPTRKAGNKRTVSPTAILIKKHFHHQRHLMKLEKRPLRRSQSMPSLHSQPPQVRPNVQRLLQARSKRSPSANIIKQEYRYASLRKVQEEARRKRSAPLIFAADHVLDPDVYQLVVTHSKRSPSANIIKKEFRYATLRKVEEDARRRRSEPLISTKGLLLDPDVYELLLAHSRRSPSANVIKKEFRYACLRQVTRTDNAIYSYDMDDAISVSTMLSTSFQYDDDDDHDNNNHPYFVYDWIAELEEPMVAYPTMFPYFVSSGYSDAGRRLSGSTLGTRQSELFLSSSESMAELTSTEETNA
ncbi:expressed unknown protein [Seminavis robusta]|uniref:Uncharacterized protein n=1 Tax=Seminavis robusta TaxID=568900 RepID=A0A9N8DTN8_9STRA|nr:expressed unknown protein [Seminavis robusta]|eukprot:Sro269_g103860.1 n/a (411) ;mRNA; f:1172-2404